MLVGSTFCRVSKFKPIFDCNPCDHWLACANSWVIELIKIILVLMGWSTLL